MALQSLILPILSVFRSAGLQQASGVLNKLTGNFDSLAGKIGLAAGSFSAFSALTTAREFAVESVNAANRFERNLLGLNQVFEDLQPRIAAFTKEVENYGLSQGQAAQAAVFLGSVLKQYGFSVDQTADQTERLVTLAQDLATTYGYDVQEALLAITALFRGEYDPIEKFGVAMKQNEVNARLAAQGLGDLEGAALANAQATARLDMLFERAADSVGAFTRASDTLYASQQRLNAIVGNLQIAFGEPLQKPLAQINNLFADLAQEYGPELVEIANAIAMGLQVVQPIIGLLGNTLMLTIAPLEQVIQLLNIAIVVITGALSPAIVVINGLLATFNGVLDLASALLIRFGDELGNATSDSEGFKGFLENLGIDPDKENSLESYIRRLNELTQAVVRSGGQTEVFNDTMHMADLGMIASAVSTANLANKGKTLEDSFRGVATGVKDAEGKLQGLAGVFDRIDEAIAKSKAKQSMEELGLSAAFIEEVLTRPNWQSIFQDIATYAGLAAIEINRIFDLTGESVRFMAILAGAKDDLLARINKAFGDAGKKATGPSKAAKDTVKSFYDTLNEEVEKQSARVKLETMGASAGLIESILGAEGWEKILAKIEKNNSALQKLQDQFNKTAAGVRELEQAQAELQRKQDEYDAAVLRIQKELDAELTRIREKAEAAKLAISDLLEGFIILPTIERTIGRFESQVTSMLASIESSLRSAFRNKDILEEGYRELQKYVQLELAELQKIGRQRDELAERYDLAQGLIDNYKRAFTAALSLTSLFGRLKDETEKRTVTVVTSGIIRLGASLREFGATITRSFEEPVAALQSKTQALLTEFRTMADKARSFAENLRKLKQLGLDPMLFNELVQAGVVAGGETAQALVDGGSETINEINTLFGEINALGADLGEEVAATMYGTGIDMADGLLNGIRSKQQELEDLARSMAEAFNREFQSKFNIQVGIAQSAAEAAARSQAAQDIAALGPRPEDIPKVDTSALQQLDALIAGATRYVGNVADATKKLGGEIKLDIYKDLRAAVAAGTAVDLSGIRAGMSSAELATAARAAAPAVVTNNFNIAPGNRMQQNETVETLRSFVNQNGSLVGFGIV